jgi:HK97 family phage major capsid protein
MTAKEFIINDLQKEKDGYISMIRNNQLSDDERKILNDKIDALDSRIEAANKLDENDNVEDKFKSLNQKFDAIKEKLNSKGMKLEDVAEPSYLESKNAVHDFAEALRQAGQSKSRMSELWGASLSKNGIGYVAGTDMAAYLPAPVKGYIEDAWNEYGDVLREFNFTGAKAFYARYTAMEQDDEDVRAKGFKSGQNKTKLEQNVTLGAKLIQSEYVYKLIPISNKTIWEDDNALIQWVVNELMKQWNYEVLRAILIGDGRATTDDSHITSIEAIADVNNNNFVGVYSTAQGASESTIEFMVDHLIEPIHNGNDDVLLFVSKADFTAMRKFIPAAGATPTYMSAEDVAKMIGVKRIVTVPYLDNTTSGAVRAIAVHANKYAITGSITPEFLSWEEPLKNDRYFRVEIPVGGGIAGLHMAYVAKNA